MGGKDIEGAVVKGLQANKGSAKRNSKDCQKEIKGSVKAVLKGLQEDKGSLGHCYPCQCDRPHFPFLFQVTIFCVTASCLPIFIVFH